MPTIYDVAREAGVSAATVSRVLNGATTVDPAMVARVLTAVRELGYRPNAVARNLRRSRTTLWAVIISDIGNPFFTAMVRGIEDVAQREGYSVVLCNSDEDPVKEETYVAAALSEQMAGVIISSSGSVKAAKTLTGSPVPVVAVDRELPRAVVDTVVVDNEAGARTATEHLLAAGYRRVACITGPEGVSTADLRLRGYTEAMRSSAPAEPVIVRTDFREQGGYDAMASLLSSPEPPDAVFVANNLMTVGALRCLAEREVAVPGRMGLVGFDEIPWADLVHPSLTTVTQPTYELGRTAARLLVDRIATPAAKPARIVLSAELHPRRSSSR
ncbi:substrate-binding domain-containing protein [Nonomuraea phyllanthi]|uniref:Substrate-binding domain-containing protein n=1 Tax=Nonomuraea phyllanthi TaxID=2219224 RepID=A0A5C4WP01_9ACTN|nr:LacI family DNA-binding transcriptional regulator [Nonomuraea phyllanthi]KAB8195450.1 substrate-binding domain-containing protein [Nonomuraea phyllanthi]QFY10416.1 substrate-binding domain-containing protein [Nonomuraea phyllanthi]